MVTLLGHCICLIFFPPYNGQHISSLKKFLAAIAHHTKRCQTVGELPFYKSNPKVLIYAAFLENSKAAIALCFLHNNQEQNISTFY